MTAAMQRLLPIIIGSIGATGQALILFHLLAACYPYKMMSQPPSEFYLVIAYVGRLASPIAAVTAACGAASGISDPAGDLRRRRTDPAQANLDFALGTTERDDSAAR